MVLHRLQDENENAFLWRLGQAKDNGEIDLDWNEIADIMNMECREDESEYRNEASYRKKYQSAKSFFNDGVFYKYQDEGSYIEELRIAKQEVRKERQKLFDERTALNKELREQGRRESMVDIVKRSIEEYLPIKFESNNIATEKSDNGCDFIIHLTDIHYGVTIDSILNTCNADILKDRLIKYADEIKNLAELYHPQNAYLILGGDLLQGLIHLNARLEAKENVVDQIMHVTDLVSNFIFAISDTFQCIDVYSTAGNHSRVTAGKEDHSRGENFDLLIPFACRKELQNISNVKFHDNLMGYDIATFDVRGHRVYATHGDKDTSNTVVYNMTKFARKAGLPLPDLCYLGHRHVNGMSTVDTVKVIESGCVDGMDSFAIDKRLVGTPEQTVTVVTEDCKVKALCDIQLD